MQFNEVFFFIIGFFSFVYGKKIEFGRPKGDRQFFSAEGRSPKAEGVEVGRSPKKSPRAGRRAPQPQSEAQTPGLKRKTCLTTKETKEAPNKHQERGDPPMQGKGTRTARATAHKGHESPEPKGTKERKAKPRTGEPQPLPPRAPKQMEQETNKGAPEGAKPDETKTKRGAKKHVQPIRKVSGFLGLRAESEANETQKEKRRTLFLQEERMQKLLNPFPKEIPCLLYLLI